MLFLLWNFCLFFLSPGIELVDYLFLMYLFYLQHTFEATALVWFDSVSLFNAISTFNGYLNPKPSVQVHAFAFSLNSCLTIPCSCGLPRFLHVF